MSFANVVKWVDMGLNVVNTGANVYGSVKMADAQANAQNNGGYIPSAPVVSKTKEEIEIERRRLEAKIERDRQTDNFNRSMMLNMMANNMPNAKKDNTVIYVAVAVAVALIFTTVMASKKTKEK